MIAQNRFNNRFAIAATVVLSIIVVLAMVAVNREPGGVAVVSGKEITKEELLFHMKLLRPYVHDEFKNDIGVELNADDWLKDTEGKSPMTVLQEKAMDEIIRDTALFLEGKRVGLISYFHYDDLLTAMRKENQRRKAAVDRGEIVYGLLSFTPDIYYSHVVSSLRTELKKALSRVKGDPLYIEESELEAAFQRDKFNWTINATSYSVTSLNFPISERTEKEAMLQKLNKLVEEGANWQDITSAYGEASQTKEEFAREDVANLNSYTNEILGQLRSLSLGQITYPIDTPQGLAVMRLDEIAFDEEQAFQEYKPRIRQALLEEKLDKYLEDCRKGLTVSVDWEKVALISL